MGKHKILTLAFVPLISLALLLAGCNHSSGSETQNTNPLNSIFPQQTTTPETLPEINSNVPRGSCEPKNLAEAIAITIEIEADFKVRVVDLPRIKKCDAVSIYISWSDPTLVAQEEVHIHGYDHKWNIIANSEIALPFTFYADETGQFEVELEGSGKKLFDLAVN